MRNRMMMRSGRRDDGLIDRHAVRDPVAGTCGNFLDHNGSGAKACGANNATRATSRGINAVRTGELLDEVIGNYWEIRGIQARARCQRVESET